MVPFRRVGVLKSRGGEISFCQDYEDSIEDIDIEEWEARRRFPNLGRRRMGQLCGRPERRGMDGRLCSGLPSRETEAVATSVFGPRVSAGGRGGSADAASFVEEVLALGLVAFVFFV